MTRNWGLPPKPGFDIRRARTARPAATLALTALYGVIGAAIAAVSFNDARGVFENVFHGRTLVMAIIAGGFGCWAYVWIARPRFAAHFTGRRDAFSDLLIFYAWGAFFLVAAWLAAGLADRLGGELISVILHCAAGGAGAAAAFQTVLAFVPEYEHPKSE